MSGVEIIGVITGALSVWFAARQNWLTWPIGIINLVMFVVMFAHERLYADVLLHVCYLGLSIYGWMNWGNQRDLVVRHMTLSETAWVCWSVPVGTMIMGDLLANHTDAAYPHADSLVTCMSIAACYLMARKALGCWIIYIVSDIIAIIIYALKGLDLTAGLYALYLLLCIKGYQSWRKELA